MKKEQIYDRKQVLDLETKLFPLLKAFSTTIGIIVMILVGNQWAKYLQTLHENQFWFSNIEEVEREISFRTEAGLYYSYFKHLTNTPSLMKGIEDLKKDNLTEHGNTINLFNRFNIHQEVFLAAVYKIYNFNLRPIFFYVSFVFSLQGLYLAIMYTITWHLTGSWLSGILTSAFVVCHRYSVTRVINSISLREQFSIPMIFAQFLVVGYYFESNSRKNNDSKKWGLIYIFIASYLFNLTWQFGPIALLLQSVCIFYLASINILDTSKVCEVLWVNFMAIVCVWYTLYYQSMHIVSLFTSFVPVATLFLQAKSPTLTKRSLGGIMKELIKSLAGLIAVILLTLVVNAILKKLIGLESDNHILYFVKDKLGFPSDKVNFETHLYLCLPAFQSLPFEFFALMTKSTMAFPLYFGFAVTQACMVALTTFSKWGNWKVSTKNGSTDNSSGTSTLSVTQRDGIRKRKKSSSSCEDTEEQLKEHFNLSIGQLMFDFISQSDPLQFILNMDKRPSLSFHVCQSLVFGILAITTQRMQVFWTPYICIFASISLANIDVWNSIIYYLQPHPNAKKSSRLRALLSSFVRIKILMFALFMLFFFNKTEIYEELEDLREFYDPDTVDLMEWIKSSTPQSAAFTGSMQLMAGVRLCTFRPITNHPHFEDKDLRDRTKDLYKIYSRVAPLEVYETLVKYNSSYIIMEDSICLHSKNFRGERCTLNDIMDLTMDFIPEDGIKKPDHLWEPPHPRFCDEVRYKKGDYSKYFKLVFENRTFRVYKVKEPSMFV